MVDWGKIASDLPSYTSVVLLIFILTVLIIAWRSGREISLWPPKMGPSIDIKLYENRLAQLTQEKDSLKNLYDQEKALLERHLKEANEKLALTIQARDELSKQVDTLKSQMNNFSNNIGAFSDPEVKRILSLFDRLAMRVPAHDEDFGLMLRSLHELRIDLQRSGISTVPHRFLNAFFSGIKNDLQTIEDMIRAFVRSDLTEATKIFDPHMSLRIMQEIAEDKGNWRDDSSGIPLNYGARHGVQLRIQDTKRLIESMVGWSWKDKKSINQEQLIAIMTFSWLLGVIDAIRSSIASQLGLLHSF